MAWLVVIVGWVGAASLVGLLVGALCRSAAIGDRVELHGARDISPLIGDRREGAADRRATTRPWASAAPGRRSDDGLRTEPDESRRAAQGAETGMTPGWIGEGDGGARSA